MLSPSFIFVLLLIWVPSSLSIEELSEENIDRFFQAHYGSLAHTKMTSAVVSVSFTNGTVRYQKGFGKQHLENPDKPNVKDVNTTAHTIFSMASVSSFYTMTGIMIAVDMGFNISKPINYYLPKLTQIPDYVVGNYTSFQGYPIHPAPELTVYDLLTHFSGLDGTGTRGRYTDLSLQPSLLDYLTFYGPRRIRTGSVATWNTHGISYAALAVEEWLRVAQPEKYANMTRIFEQFMIDQLFFPLQLTKTHMTLNYELLRDPDIQEYIMKEDGVYTQGYLLADRFYPATGVYSTSSDLIKLITLHFNGGVSERGYPIISQKSIDFMRKTHYSNLWNNPSIYNKNTGYGIGWYKSMRGSEPILSVSSFSHAWRHTVQIHESRSTILTILSLGLETPEDRLAMTEGFMDTFIRDFTCTPGGKYGDQCLVQSSVLPGVVAQDLPEINPFIGVYVSVDYAHTTWEKTHLNIFSPSYDELPMFVYLTNAVSYKQHMVADTNCYLYLGNNTFYQGVDLNVQGCLYPAPFSTNYLVSFVMNDDAPLYMVFGKEGTILPFELAGPLLTLPWKELIYFSLAFYVISGLTQLVLAIYLFMNHEEYQNHHNIKADAFITVSLASFCSIGNSLLNIISMWGLIQFSAYRILNAERLPPVVLSCCAVLGFIFWLVAVGATGNLFVESNKLVIAPLRRPFTFLKIALVAHVLGETFFFFMMLQWNWFGPSKII
eukprot:TRINITY_DN6942_c0_g1_i1.p1 TRINITY_DN6942_c0_g1~~TRINITY_DN6942_c0_g1_i1.p1  ORF type:complete len:717 (+),score=98.80 TRINITY_DN6942_c0_g1_i1:19-2169(+)